jgi:hypothetical protein
MKISFHLPYFGIILKNLLEIKNLNSKKYV